MIELKQNKWNQVVIPIPLSGKCMHDLMNIILGVKNFKYIILDDIEGFAEGYLMQILRNLQFTPIRLKDIASALQHVKGFEWGSFYLFEDYPKNWDNNGHYFDPYMVKQSDSTIRAMDGNYAYIYTPYDSVIEIIKKNFKTEDVITDYLENLDYPF